MVWRDADIDVNNHPVEEPRDTARWRRIHAWVGILAVGLPVLYLLSFGPVIFSVLKFTWQSDWLYIAYQPALWLAEAWQPYERYLEWWVERTGLAP